MTDALYQELLELREENKQQKTRIESLEHSVEALTQAILHAQKQRFGPSSEKTPKEDGQVSFFNEAEMEFNSEVDEPTEETILIPAHKRPVPKRKPGDKEKLIAELPRERVEYVINEKDAFCDLCESALIVIGKKVVRIEVDFIPAQVKVKEFVQYIYKCSACGTTDEYPDAVILKAEVPSPVMKRSLASPSSVAWIMYQKYAMAVPLCRQEKEWLRMGIALSRSTMANWVIRSADDWLKPLYNAMKEKLVTYEIIMSDETTHQCNKEPGKKASSNSYFWMHRNGACEGDPIILFEYTRTRSGEHARKFLEGFSGYLVSDAYAGYEKVENIIRCLCWTHLRRYYLDAIPLDSKKREIKGSAGAIGRDYCDKLFAIERKLKELSPEERKTQRLIQSVPVLEAFFTWAQGVFTTQTKLQTALNYTMNHREYFENFLLDGRIPISNNLSEVAIRPVAVARKNFLFSDTPRGAEASAIVFSIIATAAANGLDAFLYLEHVFRHLPSLDTDNPDIIEEYMPWSSKIPEHCQMKEKNQTNEGGANENTQH